MSSMTIWTHGLATQADNPGDFPETTPGPAALPYVVRDPGGITFSPLYGKDHTFNIPVSIPTVVDGYYMQIRSIVLLYDAPTSTINNIVLYSGANILESFEGLGWTGSHSEFDGSNFLELSPAAVVSAGLLIAMDVTFESPVISAGRLFGSVRIAGAGIDLQPGKSIVGTIGGTPIPGA